MAAKSQSDLIKRKIKSLILPVTKKLVYFYDGLSKI
jgi:hypothetical protein